MNVFLDTNSMVYFHTATENAKVAAMLKIFAQNECWLSTQVIQELCNVLKRKFKTTTPDLVRVVDESKASFHIHANQASTIKLALQIADRYQFAFYDSMIIAAALESGCSILYSEDMHHEQKIDNQLTIFNPFLL